MTSAGGSELRQQAQGHLRDPDEGAGMSRKDITLGLSAVANLQARFEQTAEPDEPREDPQPFEAWEGMEEAAMAAPEASQSDHIRRLTALNSRQGLQEQHRSGRRQLHGFKAPRSRGYRDPGGSARKKTPVKSQFAIREQKPAQGGPASAQSLLHALKGFPQTPG